MFESSRWLGLLATPEKVRTSEVYDLLSTNNNLGEKSLYLNLGYWDGSTTYDQACERLAEVLGEAAGLGAGQKVLDCGFGFADQDLYWLERFSPASIDGVNITASQVTKARERVAAAGLSDKIKLHHASATKLPFADGSFDRVLALETAFHYDTREEFFKEAFRVLKPGGILATVDPIPTDKPTGFLDRVGQRMGRGFWQIPAANLYPAAEYAAKMRKAGFAEARTESIRGKVYAPFARYAKTRLRAPEVKARMSPLVRWGFAASLAPMADMNFDYIIAVAEKQ
jgi:ubiquinone/menaquinone biosynthesis C-methylase UbiE